MYYAALMLVCLAVGSMMIDSTGVSCQRSKLASFMPSPGAYIHNKHQPHASKTFTINPYARSVLLEGSQSCT
ncbi:hypothetical protein F4809DRAFT_588598 [Biscogniauxia mediterranea]|nr:hypothetical protein F4809DRAFT_588598 [Biscogniauxia mediterranea]